MSFIKPKIGRHLTKKNCKNLLESLNFVLKKMWGILALLQKGLKEHKNKTTRYKNYINNFSFFEKLHH
jgi:hypothetical protein